MYTSFHRYSYEYFRILNKCLESYLMKMLELGLANIVFCDLLGSLTHSPNTAAKMVILRTTSGFHYILYFTILVVKSDNYITVTCGNLMYNRVFVMVNP